MLKSKFRLTEERKSRIFFCRVNLDKTDSFSNSLTKLGLGKYKYIFLGTMYHFFK